MGLDMYLMKRKTFLEPTYADIKFEPSDDTCFVIEPFSTVVKGANTITASYESIYFRKFNMIHKWFVDNIQDGKDDCGEYYVPIEMLEKLMETCNKVLENHELADELLPTKDGFFFGNIEYDEYYFDKVKYTAEQLEEVINDFKSELETIKDENNNVPITIGMYYSSSW